MPVDTAEAAEAAAVATTRSREDFDDVVSLLRVDSLAEFTWSENPLALLLARFVRLDLREVILAL